MACAQPFEIKNPHFNDFGYFQWWKQYIEELSVPSPIIL